MSQPFVFASGFVAPALLIRFLDLSRTQDAPWPWDLQVATGDSEVLSTWSVSGRSHQFVRFAVDGGGSEVGLWVADGQEPAEAPVALLDAEGGENRLLAKNLAEFLGLLGREDVELFVPQPPAEDRAADLATYRGWLGEVGVKVPRGKAAALAEKAAAAFPGLQEWLEGEDLFGESQEAAEPLAELVKWNEMDQLVARLDRGVSWDDPDTREAVQVAIYRDRQAMVKLFLERGMPVELKLHYGNTPLLEAVTCGRVEITALLVKTGANVRAKNSGGEGAVALMGEFTASKKKALEKALKG